MELRQLRCVEAVARLRHFTRAAEELHLAQSALSAQVLRLERELGTPLFERTSRRVRATEAGEAVAARARRILAEVDDARAEVSQLREGLTGRIRIGPLVPAGDVDVAGLLAAFSRAHPGVEATLREGTAAEMMARLNTDELDAAFCLLAHGVPDGFACARLGHDEVVAIIAPELAPPDPNITVAELSATSVISLRRGSAVTSVVQEMFAASGRPLQLALESGDPFLLRSLAAHGFGIAIVPKSVVALPGPKVEVRGLLPRTQLPVVLLWRAARVLSPAARAFIDHVRSTTATG